MKKHQFHKNVKHYAKQLNYSFRLCHTCRNAVLIIFVRMQTDDQEFVFTLASTGAQRQQSLRTSSVDGSLKVSGCLSTWICSNLRHHEPVKSKDYVHN